ncbi:stalk domain-containing protein [Paenibacillus sp. FSL R7-0345]|uniref:stalk domain-containing protein n=1 Tax=Paenibacillus sp. FSL R7-0345 TaxID=2954535 RepID=UPI00315B20DF
MRYFKKGFKVTLMCVLLLSVATGVSAATPIRIVVNGNPVSTDVTPKIEKGRVLVPISTIAKALDASVLWDSKSKTVKINTKDNVWDDDLAQGLHWQSIHDMIMQYIIGFDTRNDNMVEPLRSEHFDSDVIGPENVTPVGGIYPALIDTQFIDVKQDKDFITTVRVALIKQEDGLVKQTLDFVLEPAKTASDYGYFIKGVWRVKEEKLKEYSPVPGVTFEGED